MRRFLFVNICLIWATTASAQNLDQEGFIKALTGDGDIRQYVSGDELRSSERLGITYYDEKDKFLIGYGLPEEIKGIIKAGKDNYELSYPITGNGYGALTLTIPSENYKQIFYFKNDKYISPLTFHTRNYVKKESDFFRFYVDDTTYFNDYCIKKLDEFVDDMLRKMQFTALEREILINEKFNYVLCKDAEEIKLVTGYDTRGMYVKAYDAVVTTFNTHYHEVAHGLMYFKQKTNIKPELLFFQEGFAVAMGGRGGESYKVNIGLGRFLLSSSLVSYKDILSNEDFINGGASISYNIAGFYNTYLFYKFGFSEYLNLYNRFSGTEDELGRTDFSEIHYIKDEYFSMVLELYTETIRLGEIEQDSLEDDARLDSYDGKSYDEDGNEIVIQEENVKITTDDLYYIFKVRKSILLSEDKPMKNYISKKFNEIIPGREYKGEKYYISVSNDEAAVYNLYSNELIGLYAKGFSASGESVTFKDGYFEFYVRTDVFDEFLGNLKVSN